MAREEGDQEEGIGGWWLFIFRYEHILFSMARAATTTDAFNAIAEERRREIIGLLAGQERSVGELVRSTDATQPQISKHLRVLREVGLVSVRRDGRLRWYCLNAAPLQAVHDWVRPLERFWDHQLARVKARAEAQASQEPSSSSPSQPED